MRKTILSIIAFMASISTMSAINNNTVEIVYDGESANITIASNISSYVTVLSGNSSHVKITQAADFEGVGITASNTTGEITYVLSGTSTNGEFFIEGAFKQTIELNALTLTNPNGPAINIQNGKRTTISVRKGTINTLADGVDEEYNGCLHCKGHLKMKGKGTLNLTGNNKHGLYSKEYLEVKNCSINISSAVKDAIHCKQYFLMESGAITISGAGDDGLQVELEGTTSTGTLADHEDEDSGNFYMEDGALTISGYQGYAIKADGTINYEGGTQNFDKSATLVSAGIENVNAEIASGRSTVFDFSGRATNVLRKGLYIRKSDGQTRKIIVK